VTQWIAQAVVLAIHEKQINEHGGLHGIRDLPALEACLSRPQMLVAYGYPAPDIAALAACYGYGLAREHAFIEGNKRTSSVVTLTFLKLNGYDYAESVDDATRLKIWERLGDGSMSEETLAEWMRANIVKVSN
jgi:death on curing protein